MVHEEEIESLNSLISSKEIELKKTSDLLAEFSKTRCFFRQGLQQCTTIATSFDIDNQTAKVNFLTQQISLAIERRNELESFEHEETLPVSIEEKPEIPAQPIQPIQQSNTLRNALIIGGIALLVL